MHKLKDIAQLESTITAKIVEYKMMIVNDLGENITSLNRVAINRNNGYLKIETRTSLPSEIINKLESKFNLSLDYNGCVTGENNELYNYIFKPN